jgi:hypothetical protein
VRWIREIKGSMTIEAALVVPFVALVAMAFITCMQLVMAEIAMQQAVSQTVKLTAAHMYPIALVQQTSPGQQAAQVIVNAEDWMKRVDQVAEMLVSYDEQLPGQLSEGLTGATAWLRRTANDSADAGLSRVFLPMLREQLHESAWVNSERVKITDVQFPNLAERGNAYFGLTALYKMRIALPFYQTVIEIEVDAYERIWLAG